MGEGKAEPAGRECHRDASFRWCAHQKTSSPTPAIAIGTREGAPRTEALRPRHGPSHRCDPLSPGPPMHGAGGRRPGKGFPAESRQRVRKSGSKRKGQGESEEREEGETVPVEWDAMKTGIARASVASGARRPSDRGRPCTALRPPSGHRSPVTPRPPAPALRPPGKRGPGTPCAMRPRHPAPTARHTAASSGPGGRGGPVARGGPLGAGRAGRVLGRPSSRADGPGANRPGANGRRRTAAGRTATVRAGRWREVSCRGARRVRRRGSRWHHRCVGRIPVRPRAGRARSGSRGW